MVTPLLDVTDGCRTGSELREVVLGNGDAVTGGEIELRVMELETASGIVIGVDEEMGPGNVAVMEMENEVGMEMVKDVAMEIVVGIDTGWEVGIKIGIEWGMEVGIGIVTGVAPVIMEVGIVTMMEVAGSEDGVLAAGLVTLLEEDGEGGWTELVAVQQGGEGVDEESSEVVVRFREGVRVVGDRGNVVRVAEREDSDVSGAEGGRRVRKVEVMTAVLVPLAVVPCSVVSDGALRGVSISVGAVAFVVSSAGGLPFVLPPPLVVVEPSSFVAPPAALVVGSVPLAVVVPSGVVVGRVVGVTLLVRWVAFFVLLLCTILVE